MTITDNYDMWADNDSRMERELQRLPECDCCGNPIQDEHLYRIEGQNYCEHCLNEYFRKNTEDYIQ